ncbi:hypothetical protein ACO0LO_15215 [Undibacterium sp. TJN25]|uniref:hypothetical protein n=1 Tax=Undibacterium sp. TJN25 TaxID=3413056 RepID=UPI003BF1D9AA
MKLPVALVALLSVCSVSATAFAQTACTYVDQKYSCEDAGAYQGKIQKPGSPLLTADKFTNPFATEGRDSAFVTADNRRQKNTESAVITDAKGMQWTGHQIGSQTVYMSSKGAKVTCQTIGSQRACI